MGSTNIILHYCCAALFLVLVAWSLRMERNARFLRLCLRADDRFFLVRWPEEFLRQWAQVFGCDWEKTGSTQRGEPRKIYLKPLLDFTRDYGLRKMIYCGDSKTVCLVMKRDLTPPSSLAKDLGDALGLAVEYVRPTQRNEGNP